VFFLSALSFAYEVFLFSSSFTVVFWRRADHGPDRGPALPGALWVAAEWRFREIVLAGLPHRIGREISVLVGLIAAFGGYSFGDVALHGKELLRWGILWAVFFVFVGLFEEFTFRGYTQYTLAESIGFWPAAIVLSCSFGAVHLGNPGEGWVGASGAL